MSAVLVATAFAVSACGSGKSADSAPKASAATLLAAYGAPQVDLRHGDASRLCADFTPSAALHLSQEAARATGVHASADCVGVLGRLFTVSGERGADQGYGLKQALRFVGIGRITQRGDIATAAINRFFARSPAATARFKWIGGRWRVADMPRFSGAYFSCPTRRPNCHAGTFTILY